MNINIKLFIVSIILIPTFINGQTLVGTIYDEVTSEPISFASIGIKGLSVGTISNQEGKFSLEIDGADSIVISHINYGLNTFKVDIDIENQAFKIDRVIFSLDEVVVTNNTIQEILNQAILMSEEKLSSPIYVDSYYREFVKTNKKYTKYSDGIVSYFLEKKSNGKLKSKVWVKDSRAIELYDEKDEEVDWNLVSPLDLRDGLNPTLISGIGKFMSDKEQEKYEFEIKSGNITANKKLLIISILPKRDIEEMLYKGSVAIDFDTGLIMEVNYELSDYHKKFAKEVNLLVIKAKLLDSKTKITFSKSDSYYNLLYVLKDRTMKMWNQKSINEEFRFLSDLLVTNILSDPNSLKKEDVYHEKSLYKRKKPTKSDFWLNTSAIELTPEQQKIIESLKTE